MRHLLQRGILFCKAQAAEKPQDPDDDEERGRQTQQTLLPKHSMKRMQNMSPGKNWQVASGTKWQQSI